MLVIYEADDELQRIIVLIQQPDKHKIQELQAP